MFGVFESSGQPEKRGSTSASYSNDADADGIWRRSG
jgi:hypothetical protein